MKIIQHVSVISRSKILGFNSDPYPVLAAILGDKLRESSDTQFELT